MKDASASIDSNTNSKIQKQIEETKTERAKLYGSLLLFTKVFFRIRTGKEFAISHPTCRESHFITICREFTRVLRGELDLLVINVAPRYAKTELLIHFTAWAMAQFPDSNFLYTSTTHSLAATQSEIIRDIIMLQEFQELFFVNIKKSSKAKFDFKTTESGGIYAAGLDGTIIGRGAGIRHAEHFGGAILIDDAHKESEVHSDKIRKGVIDRFKGTLLGRRNDGNKTPIIAIGQSLHEDDLMAHLRGIVKKDKTGRKKLLALKSLDEAGNALYPEVHTKKDLLEMKETMPYVFAAQHQQDPLPAGGALYKEKDFLILDTEPNILATFITADTAETEKEYNDATAFSFFGIYKLKQFEQELDMYALHWLNCLEIRVEPKDLKSKFLQFYRQCMMHPVKPTHAAIEKKSTGTTLASEMGDMQGLSIIEIERTKSSGSKTDRFIRMQPYVARKQITFPNGYKHTQMCIDHCKKITANNTHAHDDICDTMCDGIQLGLIDKTIINLCVNETKQESNKILQAMVARNKHTSNLRSERWN